MTNCERGSKCKNFTSIFFSKLKMQDTISRQFLYLKEKIEICNAPKPKEPTLNAYKENTCYVYFSFRIKKNYKQLHAKYVKQTK